MNKLLIKKMRPNAQLPSRATGGSAGYDLSAALEKAITIEPGQTEIIPTGIAIALPEGTVGLVYGRSGLGIRHGISPANAVGVIDCDYRGEIMVGLHNHSSAPFTIEPGNRIAQIVITPIFTPVPTECDELPISSRGADGFGSTGL